MTAALTPEEGRVLVALARAAIEERLFGRVLLAQARAAATVTAGMEARRGCFVTLELSDGGDAPRLRGCVGSLEAGLPAHEAAIAAAVQAAFEDPRFEPLTADEYAQTTVTLSLLTPLVPVDSPGGIVAGRDGVVLEGQGRRALFLPEVAINQGWNTPTLLAHLCRKAGLPPDAWREAALWTFRSERFVSRPAEDPVRGAR